MDVMDQPATKRDLEDARQNIIVSLVLVIVANVCFIILALSFLIRRG